MPWPKGKRGADHPTWKGGRYVSSESGYAFIKKHGHPNADKRGYVREHIFVMAEHLGRSIRKGEIVHHKNDDKLDNRIENLELMSLAKHTSHHHKGRMKPNSLKNLIPGKTSKQMKAIWATSRAHHRAPPKTCDHCGKQFFKKRKKKNGYKHVYCSPECCYAARAKAQRQPRPE